MIIKTYKNIFTLLFFLGLLFFASTESKAEQIDNWESLYITPDAIMPSISFKNLSEKNSLEELSFVKYDISRSYRHAKRPVNILVKNNYLYMLDSNNSIVQFSLEKRKVINRYSLSGYKNQVASGMTIYDDSIYITFEDGSLVVYSLDAKEISWSYNVVDPINSAPVVMNNNVFFVANNTVYALSLTTRALLWNYIGSKSGVSLSTIYAPTLYSGYLFLGLSSSDVIVLRQEQGNVFFKTNISNTGEISYRINPVMGDIKSPIIPFYNSKGTNIVVGSNNRIVMFNLESKSESWRNTKIGTYSTPIVSGDSILLIDTNGNLINLNGNNGKVKWQTSLGTKVKTKKRIFWYGPLEVNGNLLIVNSVGEMIFVSKVDGSVQSYKKLFTFKKEKVFSPPVVTSEYIAVTSSYGNLYINKIKK